MKKEISLVNSLLAIAIMTLAFWGLISGFPFANFYLLIGGIISLYILGYDLKTLIRPLRKKDFLLIPIAIVSSFILSILFLTIGTLLNQQSVQNPILNGIDWSILLYTIPALFGEELLVVVLLVILEKYLPKNRNGIIIATIISSLVFGMAHLSTYDWNLWQSIVVIGLTRIPFTYVWYKSDKNLLVNGLSHYMYDNLIFIFSIIFR